MLKRHRNGTVFVVGSAASDGYVEAGDDIYFRFQGFVDNEIIPKAIISLNEFSLMTVYDNAKPPAKSHEKSQRILSKLLSKHSMRY